MASSFMFERFFTMSVSMLIKNSLNAAAFNFFGESKSGFGRLWRTIFDMVNCLLKDLCIGHMSYTSTFAFSSFLEKVFVDFQVSIETKFECCLIISLIGVGFNRSCLVYPLLLAHDCYGLRRETYFHTL